jgi:mono/diheme cytochrome c family protein
MLKAITDRIQGEPVLVLGLVTAGAALASAFGFELSAEQTAAITTFVAAVLSFVVRAKVSPVAE